MNEGRLFLCLCGSTLVWLAAPRRWQAPAAAAFSAAAIAWLAPAAAGLCALSSFASLGAYRLLGKGAPALACAAAIPLAMLAVFKSGAQGPVEPGAVSILPLGMAYYALRQTHYLVDLHAGRLGRHSIWDYAGYLVFLPAFTAGPIHRMGPFLRELGRRRFDPALISAGMERVLHGYAKVVLLGSWLLPAYAWPALAAQSQARPWLAVPLEQVQMWLRLYVLFSGYTDVAVGFSLIAGIRLPENFDRPLLATNIADFWRRWHMTLSSWCRDYVYLPAASWTRSHLAGIAAAMVVLGLWHEWSLRYVLWGVYHASAIALYYAVRPAFKDAASRPARLALAAGGWLATMAVVLGSFPVTTAVERLLRSLLG